MSLSAIEIFLLIILSQGIFLSIAIQLVPNKNASANKILTLLLIIASVMLFGRIAIYHFKFAYLWRVATLIDTTLYLFGPFLYCYIRRLTFHEDKPYRLPFVHFMPAVVYLLYFAWTLTMNVNDFNVLYFSGKLTYVFLLTELIGIVSLSFYAFKSYKLFQSFKTNQVHEISYSQSISKYIKILLLALALFIALWLYSFIGFYVFRTYSTVINYNSMWLSSSIFMYFIGFYSLTQPTIFRVPLKIKSEKSAKKSRLKKEELTILKEALDYQIKVKKIFLKPDLSLSFLANEIDTTSNNLSWYLNQVMHKNFFEFINEYRIQEFLAQIDLGKHQSNTILSIALDSGFNSKSTFNNAFKSIMKDTPYNYIKKR